MCVHVCIYIIKKVNLIIEINFKIKFLSKFDFNYIIKNSLIIGSFQVIIYKIKMKIISFHVLHDANVSIVIDGVPKAVLELESII